jgi:hypothetical protein
MDIAPITHRVFSTPSPVVTAFFIVRSIPGKAAEFPLSFVL